MTSTPTGNGNTHMLFSEKLGTGELPMFFQTFLLEKQYVVNSAGGTLDLAGELMWELDLPELNREKGGSLVLAL